MILNNHVERNILLRNILLVHSCAFFPLVLEIHVEIKVARDVADVHDGQGDDPHRHDTQQGHGHLREGVQTRLVQNQVQTIRPSFTFQIL